MQCKVYKHERDCVCINMKFSLLNNDVLGKLHYYYDSERNEVVWVRVVIVKKEEKIPEKMWRRGMRLKGREWKWNGEERLGNHCRAKRQHLTMVGFGSRNKKGQQCVCVWVSVCGSSLSHSHSHFISNIQWFN
jgi:hypothetical protein